ncbi:MAG: hypothetical protein JWM57_2057 [Phycisphaerales bacterium]|nr:hypothetical protein [Phycisphaerales bacterium]
MVDYWTTPAVLIAVLAISSVMVARLVRRHTQDQKAFALWEWSVEKRYKRLPPAVVMVDALDEIRDYALRANEHFQSRDGLTNIYRLQTVSRGDVVQHWNALVRTVEQYSTPIALRPAGAAHSLVDLMHLTLFPKLSSQNRFAVYGLRASDARDLAGSAARALLPRDIGLIRNADAVILDFTSRPFDPVEFSRVCAIAEQIVASHEKNLHSKKKSE